jgi:hypothetical protein
MSQAKHIADAETEFVVVGVSPDFCKVGKAIIPFDISQVIASEKTSYSKSVFARGEKVLLLDSVIKGVKGNAGKGVVSQVSLGSGCNKVLQGSSSVFAEGKKVARHDDLVSMNEKG